MDNRIILSNPKEIKDFILETLEEYFGKENPVEKRKEVRLNQKQAAKLLGVTEQTIISWKKKGFIPYHQVPKTRRVYYLQSELIKVNSNNTDIIK